MKSDPEIPTSSCVQSSKGWGVESITKLGQLHFQKKIVDQIFCSLCHLNSKKCLVQISTLFPTGPVG